MSRVARLGFLAALGCLLVAPSYADEILFFANGTTMPIKSHLIKDGMIHVDLGARASMAFPASSVDRIEQSGRPVYTTGGTMANQAVAGAPGSTEQDGRAMVPSQYRGGGAVRPPSTGSEGTPAPAAAMGSPVSGRLNSMMNPTGQPAPQGMQRIGNHIGFMPPKIGQPGAGPITGFGKRAAPPPPPPSAAGGEADAETPPEINPPETPPEVGHPDGDDDDGDSPE